MKTLMDRIDLIPAANCFREAAKCSREWDTLYIAALKTYGDHGSQISGCGREHFPESVKELLRVTAHKVTEWNEKGRAWKPKRVRSETMHKLARLVCKCEGSGFYGYAS